MRLYRVVLLLALLPSFALIGQPAAQADGRPVLDRAWFTRNVNREERATYREERVAPSRICCLVPAPHVVYSAANSCRLLLTKS